MSTFQVHQRKLSPVTLTLSSSFSLFQFSDSSGLNGIFEDFQAGLWNLSQRDRNFPRSIEEISVFSDGYSCLMQEKVYNQLIEDVFREKPGLFRNLSRGSDHLIPISVTL